MRRPVSRLVRPSVGVIGQVVAVLLIALLAEFATSTFLYERASSFSVQEDEARRLAEHLSVSRQLLSLSPPAERHRAAASLTTDRYAVRWYTVRPPIPPVAPSLNEMRRQILNWEPGLRGTDLRLRLASPGRRQTVAGGLKLADGSWLNFRTLHPVTGLNLFGERALLALIPAAALMLIGGVLVRRQLQPLRRLATSADRVGKGGSDGSGGDHVPVEGPGEVRRVIGAFNRMQDRIHRLLDDRTQALAAVGHDFRTPLARLRLRADRVDDRATRDAIRGDVAEMEAMVASLLAYLGGNEEPERMIRTDVAVTAATLIDDAQDGGADADYAGPFHLEAQVRPVALKRALGNLVANATRYGSRVTLHLERDGDWLVFAVEDDGPGIAEADLARAVEPFVRLDAARGRDAAGFGLGLSIVQRTVDAEGGTLRLSNRPAGGLRAEVRLPYR